MPERPPAPRPRPGRHRLPKEFIARHQRLRIVEALAEEAAAKGYGAVTVADVVRRAAIARNTFYENFSSKEECLLATAEIALAEALRRMREAAHGPDRWPLRVEAGIAAALAYVAAKPAMARVCLVESLSAGPAAAALHERAIQDCLGLLRGGRAALRDREAPPDTLEELLVGGVFRVLYKALVDGRGETVEELTPDLVGFVLAPYGDAGPT